MSKLAKLDLMKWNSTKNSFNGQLKDLFFEPYTYKITLRMYYLYTLFFWRAEFMNIFFIINYIKTMFYWVYLATEGKCKCVCVFDMCFYKSITGSTFHEYLSMSVMPLHLYAFVKSTGDPGLIRIDEEHSMSWLG